MSRAEQKQEAGRFLEFRDLEELAEYIGLYYPEEIHVFAAVEHWYTQDGTKTAPAVLILCPCGFLTMPPEI